MPAMPHRVVALCLDGLVAFDLTAPAQAFGLAAHPSGEPLYEFSTCSVGGEEVRTTSGFGVSPAAGLGALRRAETVVVPAYAAILAPPPEEALAALRAAHRRGARVLSVCTGAFALAHAGLLDGRRAATHWIGVDPLQREYPAVRVDRNAIFVCDGNVWTSAGVTTGIDMALAIVEQDHGRALADAVAAYLVLYLRRPGFQSQFSAALVAQIETSDPLGAAIAWARAHLEQVDVERFARHAGMSLRTLHRRCLDRLATTPAKLLDKLRVEHARSLLATSDLALKPLAAHCGFGNPARMNRAFERELGMSPRAYRIMHAT